jgi:hypothetical protein
METKELSLERPQRLHAPKPCRWDGSGTAITSPWDEIQSVCAQGLAQLGDVVSAAQQTLGNASYQLLHEMAASYEVVVSDISASAAASVQAVAASAKAIQDTRSRNRAAIELVKSWRSGDTREQRVTWEYLRRELDKDRPAERKLFA